MGRPRSIDYDKVVELAHQGLSDHEIEWKVGASKRTVRDIMKTEPTVARERVVVLGKRIAGRAREGRGVDAVLKEFGISRPQALECLFCYHRYTPPSP